MNRKSPGDILHNRLDQADALASLLYAEPGEQFRMGGADHQDRVLWLLSDLIGEAREALRELDDANKSEARS